jgi:chromosome segregation ATPase
MADKSVELQNLKKTSDQTVQDLKNATATLSNLTGQRDRIKKAMDTLTEQETDWESLQKTFKSTDLPTKWSGDRRNDAKKNWDNAKSDFDEITKTITSAHTTLSNKLHELNTQITTLDGSILKLNGQLASSASKMKTLQKGV